MQRLQLSAIAMLALASFSAAQTVTLPANLGPGAEGSSSTGTLFSAISTGVRQQMIYGEASLPQGHLIITGLRFRHNGGTTVTTGGTWSGATVDMCTSVNAVGSVSTTFASNLGADLVNVYSGNIVVAPTALAYPGVNYVDITLSTPFVYTHGGDLLIDVTLPAAGWGGGTTTTTDYHIPTGTPASRVYSTTPTNATGSVNNGAGIVCELVYSVDPQSALKGVTGYGCYDSMFYEFFSAASSADVSNTALRMQPNGMGGYDVFPIPLNYVAPTSAPSGQVDDGLVQFTLPFSFPFPGGSTTDVQMCTNGFIWLDPTQTSTDFSPSASEMTTLAPRLAVAWTDWNASPTSTSGGGSLNFDIDPSNQIVYLTWNGIAAYGWTSTYGGPVYSTFQAKMFSDGSVEYHYVSVNNPYPIRDMLIGLKPDAATHVDPGAIDISTINIISTVAGTDAGLRLAITGVPATGSSVSFDTSNIPATALLGGTLVALLPGTGVDLGFLGMPSCRQYVDLGTSATLGLLFSGPTGSLNFNIPNDPAYIGLPIYGQSIAIVPGVNTLGAINSNGADLTIGAF
ncbi:MAG: hypothetical protein KDC48_04455 [Planctomycetes bacterium]|nr:hypothetical protein [Planctomycetota bacterium]